MIDPATLTLIGKLIGLGLAVKKGMESDKLDENDVGALKSFLETGTELSKLWSRGRDSRAAALHLALVTRAFGKALAQYWVSLEMITPDVIERCLKRASLEVADPNRDLPDEKALALPTRAAQERARRWVLHPSGRSIASWRASAPLSVLLVHV
ncbi:MAG TPA: hypothetical protein VNM90_28440 [Haliangium sp.]|nr:hypothetical protein [Haliangium sp.]